MSVLVLLNYGILGATENSQSLLVASKLRYYSSRKSHFNHCASGIFLFWEELKL